jgi:hypothetical protein
MPRNPHTTNTSQVHPAPGRLLGFIQRAQLVLVYSRRREGRLPLHDSFRLTLGERIRCGTSATSQSGAGRANRMQPTVYVDRTNNQQNA